MRWWLTGSVVLSGILAGALFLGRGWSPVSPALAQGGGKGGERTITTTGTATVKVKPDTVRVSFGVSASAGKFTDAFMEGEKKTRNIVTALKGLKLTGLEVRTSPMHVVTTAVPGAKSSESHQITYGFTVIAKGKTADALVRAADLILSTAWSNGANTAAPTAPNPLNLGLVQTPPNGSKVELYCEDDSEYRREALKEAVKAALGHARAVAGTAKLTIRDTVTLTDQPSNPLTGFGALGLGVTLPRTDVTGETEVTVAVSVTSSY